MDKPCCVCYEPGGHHCTKCKSRRYCSKACQLVDWYERGHKPQCKRLAAECTGRLGSLSLKLAAEFRDRLLDARLPEKLKVKEEPPIVEGVAPAAGLKAAARLSAIVDDVAPAAGSRAPVARTAVKASMPNGDTPDWRGKCAICLGLLPLKAGEQRFYECCCRRTCLECSVESLQRDVRCPLCRAPAPSATEALLQLQKHVDEENAEAQVELGYAYRDGSMGLKMSSKRAFSLYELAAVQGHAVAQAALGCCYQFEQGVKLDYEAAARWSRRAAERGHPTAQNNLGLLFYNGTGVAQSYDDAVRWWRLAAAQGDREALFNLGLCLASSRGVPRTAARRCASSSAPRPRGTPRLRWRSKSGRRREGGDRRAQCQGAPSRQKSWQKRFSQMRKPTSKSASSSQSPSHCSVCLCKDSPSPLGRVLTRRAAASRPSCRRRPGSARWRHEPTVDLFQVDCCK